MEIKLFEQNWRDNKNLHEEGEDEEVEDDSSDNFFSKCSKNKASSSYGISAKSIATCFKFSKYFGTICGILI